MIQLSAKNFIRNIITQVAERHLLQGMYSIFNSVEILGMSNQTVEAIAAENKETRDRRLVLKTQKKAIEEAKDICANLAMRKELRMVSYPVPVRVRNSYSHHLSFQYADETRDDFEDTSDEEGQPRPHERPPSISKQPPTPSIRRRASRRSREDNAPPAPAPRAAADPVVANGIHGTEFPTAHHAPPRNEPAPPPRLAEQQQQAVTASPNPNPNPNPPQQAPPPPPPRPDKVRPESRPPYSAEQYYAGGGGGSPYEPRAPASPGVDGDGYVQSAARRQQRNILGRA